MPEYDIGNRSGRMWPDQQQHPHYSGAVRQEALEGFGGKRSYEAMKAAWEREREGGMRRC